MKNNDGWQVKSLGEVTEIVTGGTPSTTIKEFWDGGDIAWLNSGELNQGIITSSSNYITKLGLKNSVAKLMPPDTVLIALTGATTGKVGYLTFEACANQSVTGILPSPSHDPKFIYYYLQTLREKILRVAWGGAQKHIHQQFVKNLKVPLPPLPIQKQIAEILNKADEAKQKRKEANKFTDEFLQSVFIEMFGDPVKNQKGWEVKKFGCIFNSIRYGTGSPPTYVKNGIPFIRATNIKYNSIVENDLVFISKEDANKIKKCELREGNLLVVRSGINTGDAAVVPKEFDGAYAAYDLIIELDYVHSIFYSFLINSTYGKAIIGPLSRRAGQPHLNAEQLKDIEFYLPPFKLQQQFAEIVNKVEALKEKQKQSELELENLFQSLMQRAFKGELVS
jgi:type I restriction enzyme, S subunit